MTERKRYRVWMHIASGMGQPSYDGYVYVWADGTEDARGRAKRKLKRTSFPDVWKDEMRVEKVEVR
jgi:hypothetical protein